MIDVQTWLDQSKALADRATQGPWEARSSEVTMNDRGEWKIGKHNHPQVLRSVMRGDDAVFIADARTRLPLALDALQAVLTLHQPVEVEPSATICGECSNRLPNGRFMPIAEHPCPTFLAIKDALGENNE